MANSDQSTIVQSALGKRIIFFMLMAGLIPLLVFTVPMYVQSYNILESETKQSLEDYAKLASGQLFQTLQQAKNQLLRLEATEQQPPSSADLRYFTRIDRFQTVSDLRISDGVLPSDFDRKIKRLDTDSNLDVILTPVYRRNGAITASLIAPASGDSYWVAELKPSVLWEPLRPSFFGDRDVVMVVDERERILATSRQQLFGLFEPLAGYFTKNIPNGRIGQGQGRLEGFGRVYWVSKQLWLEGAFGTETWRILLFRPQSAVQSLPITLLQTLGIWLVIALSGLILLSFRFARRLYEPIDQLRHATNEISAGHWDTSVTADTGDELEQLADNFNSMRDTIQERNQQLKHDATHDRLTGLPNRVYLEERLDHLLNVRADGPDRSFGVVLFDLDRFKVINDSLGHKAGDELLKAVADRLRSREGNTDTIARMGGDEFVLILDDITEDRQIKTVAERLIELLKEPFEIRDQSIYIDVSMGITVNHGRYTAPEDVIRDADTAMNRAKKKETTESTYVIFGDTMRNEAKDRLDLETDIKRAVEDEQFELRYQPIIDLETASLSGAEVLIRWEHPQRGLLSPGTFIAIAEEIGTIKEIGKWVLRETFAVQHEWKNEFEEYDGWISVNLSPKQLYDQSFLHDIDDICQSADHDPADIKLELTENTLMSSKERAINLLGELRDQGFRIALDDFGTGYSSLSLLKNIPLDVLKVDREFIRDIHESEHQRAILAAVLGMAGQMSLDVVAEGIEIEEEYDYIVETECQLAQGYYFARPMTAAEYHSLLVEDASGHLDLPGD